jgi:hypothetical protein
MGMFSSGDDNECYYMGISAFSFQFSFDQIGTSIYCVSFDQLNALPVSVLDTADRQHFITENYALKSFPLPFCF